MDRKRSGAGLPEERGSQAPGRYAVELGRSGLKYSAAAVGRTAGPSEGAFHGGEEVASASWQKEGLLR